MECRPYCIECASSAAEPIAQLFRMRDGAFQIVSQGRIKALHFGPDHILAETSLASTLLAVCAPDIETHPAVIINRSTDERLTTHAEVIALRTLQQDQFSGNSLPEGNAWQFERRLFVAPHVREMLVNLGLPDLQFSLGLSNFG